MGVIRSIGTGIAWSTSGVFAAKIIGFVNIFIILSHLTVYEYGLTELTLSVVTAMGIFMLPGLVPAVTSDLGVERARGNYSRMKGIFHEYLGFSMLLGVVAWAILFFGSTVVAQFTGNVLIDSFFKIVAFLFLTSPIRSATLMLATAFVRYADQSFFSVVEEAAKGGFLVFFFFMLGHGADGLLYAAVFSQVLAIVLFLPRTLSAYRVFSGAPLDESISIFNILAHHRKWGVGASYVGQFGQNIRLWFIKILLGTEAVGLFAFAYGIISHALGLVPLGPVLNALTPAYADKKRELARLVRGAFKLQLVIVVFGIIAGLFFVHPFVTTFFSKYSIAIPLISMLLFSMIPNSVSSIMGPAFTSIKEQKSLFFTTVFKTILTALLTPLAIVLFGFYGMGVELFLTSMIVAIERVWRFSRLVPEFRFERRVMFSLDEQERVLVRLVAERLRLGFLVRRLPF